MCRMSRGHDCGRNCTRQLHVTLCTGNKSGVYQSPNMGIQARLHVRESDPHDRLAYLHQECFTEIEVL